MGSNSGARLIDSSASLSVQSFLGPSPKVFILTSENGSGPGLTPKVGSGNVSEVRPGLAPNRPPTIGEQVCPGLSPKVGSRKLSEARLGLTPNRSPTYAVKPAQVSLSDSWLHRCRVGIVDIVVVWSG
ncbi:hypothetical protein F2Q69_00014753 [Brassica cretica]|uniref:Uncharacterized protein n=1 Tax=Brassica cretica TaxID=69181 RepID=A0A8S9QV36_BRACR|nr:hypothetical protein F2Q69_00014753 [Brassica cretica]